VHATAVEPHNPGDPHAKAATLKDFA
jgi:hypothetical protein